MHSTLVVAATALLLLPAPSAAQTAQARQSAVARPDGAVAVAPGSRRAGEPERRPDLRHRLREPDEDDQAASEPVLERSSGSGVILDADGYIVTNAHVVERATRVEVELSLAATGGASGGRSCGGAAASSAPRSSPSISETDVAVLKVDMKGLPVLPFGDSEGLRPGQIVLAFGSPLGLESSVTLGVVSAVARQLTPDDPMIYIQTDAPINPGNSGGAVVDTEGRLVGISTLIYSQSGGNEGIGFAAPSNIVRNVFMQIRKTGRVRRGEIGIHAQTITPLMAEALGLTVRRRRRCIRRRARRAGRTCRTAAGRPRAGARRQADGERAAVAHQSLRPRHQRHGDAGRPARRTEAEPASSRRRARQRHRPSQRSHCSPESRARARASLAWT